MTRTYLMSGFYFKVQILQDGWLVLTVFHVQVFEFYGSSTRPRRFGFLVCGRQRSFETRLRLSRKLRVVLRACARAHVCGVCVDVCVCVCVCARASDNGRTEVGQHVSVETDSGYECKVHTRVRDCVQDHRQGGDPDCMSPENLMKR